MSTENRVTYSKELAAKICFLVATHPHGYDKIKKMYEGLPCRMTMEEWRAFHPDFAEDYLKAKKLQAILLAEETLDICDHIESYNDRHGNTRVDPGLVAKANLQIKTRQWHAKNLAPHVYGDKQIVETITPESEALKKELNELRSKLDSQFKRDH